MTSSVYCWLHDKTNSLLPLRPPVGASRHLIAGVLLAASASAIADEAPGKPASPATSISLHEQQGATASSGPEVSDVRALREELARQNVLLKKLMAQQAGQVPAETASRATSSMDAKFAAPTTAAPAAGMPEEVTPVSEPGSTDVSAVVAPRRQALPQVEPEITDNVQNKTTQDKAGEPAQGHAPVPAQISSPGAGSPQPALTSENDHRAYASGVTLAGEVRQLLAVQQSLGISLPAGLVMQGLQDAFNQKPLRMTGEDIQMQMSALNTDFTTRMQTRRDEEVAQGRAFRHAFRKRKGAYVDAGSLYLVSSRGGAVHLKTTDLATLRITGTLPDGTVFDGSGQAGQTRKVKVGAMLPAVAIGLQKVGVGGHLTVVVPPEKGYGDMGLPPVVPGGATLIFDITVEGANDAG